MAWRPTAQIQTANFDPGESTLRGAILQRAARPTAARRQQRPVAPPRATGARRRAVPPSAATPPPRPEPPETWCAEVFDLIEWRRFEYLVEALFAQAGFETRTQACGADGGVDIWLHSKNRGGAAVSIVQCKHWTVWKVGVKPVRELRGVMAAHGISRGQFVTTSRYTAEARAFARDNGIMLHDASSLLDLIASRDAKQQQDLLRVAFYGEYWRPTCASCGIKLVERESHDGGKPFWGCRNYPKCKTMMRRG
jgi:restriction system protein